MTEASVASSAPGTGRRRLLRRALGSFERCGLGPCWIWEVSWIGLRRTRWCSFENSILELSRTFGDFHFAPQTPISS